MAAPQATAAAFAGPVRHLYVHVPFCARAATTATSTRRRWARRGRRSRPWPRCSTPTWRPSPPSGSSSGRRTTCAASRRSTSAAARPRCSGRAASSGSSRRSRRGSRRTPRSRSRRTLTRPTRRSPCGPPSRGVRVSLGVQSFLPRLRAALGRRPAADPAAAARRLRAAGVRDLSIDLIHGIPGQTAADLDVDLAAVDDLGPEHVSWYELDCRRGDAAGAASRERGVTVVGEALRRPGVVAGRRRARRDVPPHRARPRAARLPLVRGQQLRPAGAARAPQRGVLARPRRTSVWDREP